MRSSDPKKSWSAGASRFGSLPGRTFGSKVFFSGMFWAHSLLVYWIVQWVRMFMRKSKKSNFQKSITYALLLICAGRVPLQAHTVIDPSPTAPTGLEKDFIAQTTTQFNATLFVNPLASNTYAIKLLGPLQKTVVGNSEDACIAVGFLGGMEEERRLSIESLRFMQAIDLSSGTCAGFLVSSATAQNCQYVYNEIGNAIMQRWLAVYSSTGSEVAP